MDQNGWNFFLLLAEAFCYPDPGRVEVLESALARLPHGQEMQSIERFLVKVRSFPLSEWEELYTRTFDLNPPTAPYIGFQMWGEGYQRGSFLAKMNRVLLDNEIEAEGELPDHLIPVLRYLGQADQPLPELREVLLPALQRMQSGLRKADSQNPYLLLLEGALRVCGDQVKEAA